MKDDTTTIVKEEPTFKAIKDWDISERPREKLEAFGPSALTNSELLAILIGGGCVGVSATTLMQNILNHCHNNLRELSKWHIDDYLHYKGIGKAKAITIIAACELGRRRAKEEAIHRLSLNNPDSIIEYFTSTMEDFEREEFHVLYFNQSLQLLADKVLAKGGITATTVDLRLLAKEALLLNATCVAVCHNHPSGNPHPSESDNQLTQRIKQALAFFDIKLIDHIIIGNNSHYSYVENCNL